MLCRCLMMLLVMAALHASPVQTWITLWQCYTATPDLQYGGYACMLAA